jgi:hypothetical protein
LAPNAIIHARLASTTPRGDAVCTTRVMRHPACRSNLRYSSAVRSLPARLSSISKSIHLPMKPRSSVGITVSTSNKRQQVRRRYVTEKEARDALSEIGQAAATDEFVPRKAVTVEQLAADWLASLHNTRPTTVNGYTYLLAPLREQHGNLAVQKLTRPDLDKLLIALRDGGTLTGKGRARRPWSARSLNKSVDCWRALLDYGIERRELPRNVAAAMRKVPRTRNEPATYTPHEIRLVLRAADKDRSGHLWWLALSGLRRGELAGLMWSDVDLEAKTLSIDRVRVAAGAGVVLQNDPKTRSSRRTLPLDDGLVAALRRRVGPLRTGAARPRLCPH